MGLWVATLAISLQLWPASRICFNRCSSACVHGVLVRPRFFVLSSESKAGIDTLGLVNAGVVADGSVVPGGRVFSFGLFEALRLRGLGVKVDGGGCRSSTLGLGASGVCGAGTSLLAVLGDVVGDCF